MSSNFNYLDLFAGAGGLSEGFIRAGYNPIAHVEMDQAACYTLRTRMAYHHLKDTGNLDQYADYLKGKIDRQEFYDLVSDEIIGSVINVEISDETLRDIFCQIDNVLGNQEINLIIGGPPCQAYSYIGRARCPNRMKGDPRNDLYLLYGKFLKKYKPKYFMFENVPGLLSATNENGEFYLDLMQTLFRKEYGYETELKTLNAKNHGVPQNRKRIILFGRKKNSIKFYPEPDNQELEVSVTEILSDLPALKAGEGTIGPCEINSYDGTWLYEVGIRNDELPVTLHQARTHNKRDREIYKMTVELWNATEGRLRYNELPERL